MTEARPIVAVGRRRWVGNGLRLALVVAVLVTAAGDLYLFVGPTRPARYRGKRVAAGRDYRISYEYADGERLASDTDHVAEAYFFAHHAADPLAVRTFGVGTARLARLAGADPAAGTRAAARWAAVAAGLGLLGWLDGRRHAPAPGSLAARP